MRVTLVVMRSVSLMMFEPLSGPCGEGGRSEG